MSIEDRIRKMAHQERPPSAETRRSAIELVDFLRQIRAYDLRATLEGRTIVIHSILWSVGDNPIPVRWTVYDSNTLFDWKEDWED